MKALEIVDGLFFLEFFDLSRPESHQMNWFFLDFKGLLFLRLDFEVGLQLRFGRIHV